MGLLPTTEHKDWNQSEEELKKKNQNRTMMNRFWGVGDGDGHSYTWRLVGGGGDIPDVALLLLGEFQSVAEDLDSLLFITVSTCLGRLTVDTEHLPKKPRERHTDVHTWLRGRSGTCAAPCVTLRRRCNKHTPARCKVTDCEHEQSHWGQVLFAGCFIVQARTLASTICFLQHALRWTRRLV